MARPRKPTNVLDLTGALAKNPQRYADRANEPQCSEPLGPPPESLASGVRVAWMEIDRLAPWLTAADRIAVEVAASLLALFRAGGASMVSPAHLTRLETMLGRLGLTPADRSKVSVGKEEKRGNPFAANRKRPGLGA